MDCLSPITIKKPQTQGFGYMPVPCGKCLPCLKRRAAEWSFRLRQEIHISKFPRFITLTYEDSFIPVSSKGFDTLRKSDAKAFLKRLRESLRRSGELYPLRYYLAGEYGPETIRPHYHAIIFNVKDEELIIKAWRSQEKDLYYGDKQLIGHIDFGKVSEASINYVTAYIQKTPLEIDFKARCMEKPFSLMSKGLGKNYLDTHKKYHEISKHFFITSQGGAKQILPRYYKQKIFSDGQRSAFAESIMVKVSERVMAERERIKSLGNNEIGDYQFQQKQQYIANHIKKTKQQKL